MSAPTTPLFVLRKHKSPGCGRERKSGLVLCKFLRLNNLGFITAARGREAEGKGPAIAPCSRRLYIYVGTRLFSHSPKGTYVHTESGEREDENSAFFIIQDADKFAALPLRRRTASLLFKRRGFFPCKSAVRPILNSPPEDQPLPFFNKNIIQRASTLR